MKKIVKTLILLLVPVSLAAQLTPVTDQYILNPLTINPSYAGSRGGLSVAAFYRQQWVGISGAPRTMSFQVDAPVLSNKLGLGLFVVNDQIGVTRQTELMTSYAFRINLGGGVLALGLGAGLVATNTAWSDLIVLDPGDEYYLIDSRVFIVPDFSFGVYYNVKNYFVGFSVPRLLGYQFDFDRNKYSLKVEPGQYNYILNTGYLFSLGQKTKFMPSALLSYSIGDKFLYDVSAHFIMNDRLWLGATYRSTSSVTALAQFAINNQFKVAYSYDFNFGTLGNYNNGSHEIMLRYEFRYKVDVINPLIF
ncbi:MAG: type IX secretion system membrane protein PorP/SprF [Bacteroidales bacterium]